MIDKAIDEANTKFVIENLEQKLNIKIKNPNLFLEALTHSSYLNENKHWPYACNERLEFLGDAVLELCISDYIFRKYPDYPEGKLTPLRSNLVNSLMLSNVALYLDLDKSLYVSKGERMVLDKFLKMLARNTDPNINIKSYSLADAVEAVFGAVYLDTDFETTKKVIMSTIQPFLETIVSLNTHKDSKSLLQELTQKLYGITPEYKTLFSEGPAHQIRYIVGVFLKDLQLATGEGWSKKEAEEYAAAKALADQSWIQKDLTLNV